ncbi:hypothetical protein [Ruminococcus sp.]|uniref:hypothetical protein n=1 Tax=Ruminococcus sp. TaxID=41978 RepID=UPI0025F8A2CE|nr:hypothetical protein [Ruminococcus sp.]MBQ8967137.1 hypothetical protein [Ruminococcus sp.]
MSVARNAVVPEDNGYMTKVKAPMAVGEANAFPPDLSAYGFNSMDGVEDKVLEDGTDRDIGTKYVYNYSTSPTAVEEGSDYKCLETVVLSVVKTEKDAEDPNAIIYNKQGNVELGAISIDKTVIGFEQGSNLEKQLEDEFEITVTMEKADGTDNQYSYTRDITSGEVTAKPLVPMNTTTEHLIVNRIDRTVLSLSKTAEMTKYT